MFDWFLSTDKKISKHQRCVTNRDSQAEDRENSARWLVQEGSPKALRALLTRFDMNLTQQLNDKDEKEVVYGLLGAKGAEVLKPLRYHLRRCRQIAWPFRLLEEIEGLERTILTVGDLLKIELERDDLNNPAKKKHMLVWLTEHRHAAALDMAMPFVDDFDEGVRYAAAEVMLAQNDDRARDILAKRFVHPDEDSNRLKVRLVEVFIQRRWKLDDPEAVSEVVPVGFGVRDGRFVKL